MNSTSAQPKPISTYSRQIADDLLTIGAVKFSVAQPFTWVSGIKSPVYCDNRKVFSYVEIRNRVTDAFVEVIRERFPDAELIAGVATGGIPSGMLIADRLKLPFIYVRQAPKEHGMKKQIEGDYEQGNKVVLIEDHISTGGSSLSVAKAMVSEKLNLLGLISLMTYQFKKAEDAFRNENIKMLSLCDLDTVLDVALNTNRISAQEKETIVNFRNSI